MVIHCHKSKAYYKSAKFFFAMVIFTGIPHELPHTMVRMNIRKFL